MKLSRNVSARPTIRKIFQSVAESHGLTEADLLVRDRSGPVAAARHEAWAKCRRAGMTLQAIASVGGWDHTTVREGAMKGAL